MNTPLESMKEIESLLLKNESIVHKFSDWLVTNQRVLHIQDGCVVRETHLKDVSTIELERRCSFRHPIIGVLFALCMIIPSAYYLSVVVYHNAYFSLFNSYRGGVAVLFGLGLGIYVIYTIVSGKTQYWFKLSKVDGGSSEIPIQAISDQEAKELLDVIKRVKGIPFSSVDLTH